MTPIRRMVVALVALAGLGGGAAVASIVWIRAHQPSPPDDDALPGVGDTFPAPQGAESHPTILSVTDAVEAHDGSWVVLDGRASRWHLLSPAGALERSAGRAGDGPGELRSPSSLAMIGDTVLVGSRTAGTVERFHTDGRPIDRLRVGVPGCDAGVLRRLVVVDGLLHLLRECLDPESGGSTMQVHRVGPDGAVVMVTSRPWTDLSGAGTLRVGRPILAGGGGLLLFGDATEDCLLVLLPHRRAGERVCHPDPPRVPLPEEARVRAEQVKDRLSAQGLALEVPDVEPPFDAVFAGGAPGVVFRSIRTGGRRSLDLLEGGSLAGLPPDGFWPPLTFVGVTSILAAGETVGGTWVVVRPRG